MADEKVIKIVTETGGSQGPDPGIKAQQEAAAAQFRANKAVQEAAAKQKAWIDQQTQAMSYATAPWSPAQGGQGGQGGQTGTGRGRGRPRNPYTPPPAPPFPPGGGNPKAPPIAGGGQQGGSGAPAAISLTWKDAYKQLQKFVAAMDGVNGHLTKTLAALKRGHEFVTQAVEGLKQYNSQLRAAGHAQSKASQVVTAAWGKAGPAIGMVGKVAGTAAAAIGILALAAKLTSRLFENLQEVVGEFSGALQAAKAQTEITLIKARLRSASRIGGELASLERVNAELKEELIELKTTLIEGIYPVIQMAGEQLGTLLKVVNFILKVQTDTWQTMERLIELVLELATHVPVLGKAAKKALEWMKQDEINNIKASASINKQIEDIFDPANVFPEKPKKNSIPQRFLP
jgi:cell division septum initiation protein DivIVA